MVGDSHQTSCFLAILLFDDELSDIIYWFRVNYFAPRIKKASSGY